MLGKLSSSMLYPQAGNIWNVVQSLQIGAEVMAWRFKMLAAITEG